MMLCAPAGEGKNRVFASALDKLLPCPMCKGKLDSGFEEYSCPLRPTVSGRCGNPDLRVYPDPYVGCEDDPRKGKVLREEVGSIDFAELVRSYWQITPEIPPDLKERFTRHVLAAGGLQCGAKSNNWVWPVRADS